jgi:hypothetical protein
MARVIFLLTVYARIISFNREDFLEINQSETRIACGGHVCYPIGTTLAIFIEDLP